MLSFPRQCWDKINAGPLWDFAADSLRMEKPKCVDSLTVATRSRSLSQAS